MNAAISAKYGIVNHGRHGMEVQQDGKPPVIFNQHPAQEGNWRAAVLFCQVHEQTPCQHPPAQQFAWVAYDKTLVVCCKQCGQVLQGAAQ
jgi:hypothetical protein